MPYIKKKDRENLNLRSPGELNYHFSRLCALYLQEHGECYATMNDIMGALEGCKLEFYRRVCAPYEDLKKVENGDVY